MDAKIGLEVWSGALGVPVMKKQLDTAKLTADEQADLEQLINSSGVLQLPETRPPPSKARDTSQVKLVLDIAGKTQTVRVAAESISPPLRRLIDFLKARGS